MRYTAMIACALGASAFVTASAQVQGPSSSQTPYLVPVAPGVTTISILTVGDSPQSNPNYRMVGIPDGLGAYSTAGGTLRLLMNHELPSDVGVVRAHGQKGAFVSDWTISRTDLSVVSGADLIQNATIVNGAPAFGRFCSADLADRSAFYLNLNANLDFNPYLYLNGEEVGSEGRCFAHVASGVQQGESFELPSLGKFSIENVLARPGVSLRTVVAGLDDSTPGQVYFYIGTKQPFGSPIVRAGLTNGRLFGVRVPGVPLEDRTNGINGVTRFELAELGDVSGLNGAAIQTASVAAGVTEFLRPEDGAWDPENPRNFFFVTTDRFNSSAQVGRSRLWRLTFDNYQRPALGGTIRMLLDGTEGQQMLDNLTIDRHGNLVIQEDPGNQDHLASVWFYDVHSDQLTKIAQHDPARFAPGAANFITKDEESSGVIDARAILGPGWFLLDVQAHYATDTELVEGGQLLALYNPASN
jgi:hypothetical protein